MGGSWQSIVFVHRDDASQHAHTPRRKSSHCGFGSFLGARNGQLCFTDKTTARKTSGRQTMDMAIHEHHARFLVQVSLLMIAIWKQLTQGRPESTLETH